MRTSWLCNRERNLEGGKERAGKRTERMERTEGEETNKISRDLLVYLF
jgi:hypothetical protein